MDAAFLLAVYHNDLAAVEHRLAAGADLAAVDGKGWSALHVAASRGFAAMTKLLLRRGASVDARTRYGGTPLHLATGAECCRMLALAGADVDAVNCRGETPLHYAAVGKPADSPSVEQLLAAGADARCRNSAGLTPAGAAYLYGRVEAAALLEDAAAACARWSGLRAAVITAWCLGCQG